MDAITMKPIGYIRTEHTMEEETPIQPVYAWECVGYVEVFPEFVEGLEDIEGFSHIILLYWHHKTRNMQLRVKPFLEDLEHGVFATRAPLRPNPIGLSIVRLVKRKAGMLIIEGADILDGTPLLDIKPYSSRFDSFTCARNGWQEKVDPETAERRGKRGYVSPGNGIYLK